MREKIDSDRRHFLKLAAVTAAAQGLGAVGAARIQPARATAFGELRRVDAGVLSIGYADVGPASGSPVVLLHGWPYDSSGRRHHPGGASTTRPSSARRERSTTRIT
jgi:hypothetical protein